ncbi:glycosyltransferase [Sphingosinithalassobacter sp. LHW66-3]|uniref:glycosyltransferase n=1 Tax=Sphingosinithalassobacter sp. LHW66-3 TaxID=3424718 RepID=UPI003D6AD3EA
MPDSPHRTAERIATIAQTLEGGGVERAMLRLARGWIDAGREVTLIAGRATGPLAAELPAGIHIEELGDSRYRALYALPRFLDRLRPDLLFCPGNHYTSLAAWTRLRMGSACPPIVAKVSNALVRPEMRGIERRGYPHWLRLHPRFIDRFVAMSPAMAAETARQMRVDPARVSVIANPPARALAEAAPLMLPAGRYLLGAGRLEPQKRWDRLIEALPRLKRGDVSLLLLGEGSLRRALEAQVAALGLRDRVHLPGHAADPLPAIARAEAVVLTSDYEGVPGVLREALALGTPVVTTDSSVAIAELVPTPGHGSIVPPGDAEALVAALDHWLAPERQRPEPLAQTGPDSVAAYLALFDELVAQRSR